MNERVRGALRILALASVLTGCGAAEEGVGEPVEVPPAPAEDAPVVVGDAAPAPDAGRPAGTGGTAIWVVDAADTPVGVLVRRGSDDSIADLAIYDLVTVFNPPAGLFFDVTMADGKVRYPAKVFFAGASCGTPVGVSVGGCTACRSGYGVGFLHDGTWWRMVGGVSYEQMSNGSTRDPGVSETCVAHGTTNAKAFPIEAVSGVTPPTTLKPPLRFAWR